MSAGEQSTATSPLTREQVLDELEYLAKVEHALVIECLSVCYALGYDLGPDEGGPTTGPGSEAAGAAMSLARNTEMFHLEDLNLALIHASRPTQMDWAASISGAPGSDIPLGPPDLTQLQQLVAREQTIATAVDARYARLVPAVTSTCSTSCNPSSSTTAPATRPRSRSSRIRWPASRRATTCARPDAKPPIPSRSACWRQATAATD